MPRSSKRGKNADDEKRFRRLKSAGAEGDAAFGQIVGGDLHGNLVAGKNSDVVLAHLSGNVGHHDVAVLKLHSEGGVGQELKHGALHFDTFFFCHRFSVNSSFGSRRFKKRLHYTPRTGYFIALW